MNDKEYEIFLNRTLNLLENCVNFLDIQKKHILAYRKMIGIQQKFDGELDDEMRQKMQLDTMKIRTILHYLLNGEYSKASDVIKQLKKSLYHKLYMCKVSNENDND